MICFDLVNIGVMYLIDTIYNFIYNSINTQNGLVL